MTGCRIAGLLLGAAVALTGAVVYADGGEGFDLTKRVWVGGRTVDVFVLMPQIAGGKGPNEPSAAYADVDVYLIGSVDEGDSYGPEVRRPAIDPATGRPLLDEHGRPIGEIVIPAHDDTFASYAGADAPVDTFGHWVIAGPRATAETVRTRAMPEQSLAGAPLAYAINFGDEWQPLTDAALVKRGLDSGLLALKFSNWGGVAWLAGRPAPKTD
ncbi:MAG: hypothetical protein IT495_07455 [Gammaproteobacteria bacterium]|nr:hypothetical protein [Gammaproteobacteria bacterium]